MLLTRNTAVQTKAGLPSLISRSLQYVNINKLLPYVSATPYPDDEVISRACGGSKVPVLVLGLRVPAGSGPNPSHDSPAAIS
jgi:hypothetical protein